MAQAKTNLKLRPKSSLQIRRLFGLAAKPASVAGVRAHDYLSELASDVTRGRTSSLAALHFDEANAMITRLGGDPITSRSVSKRTENYRKQKAGIETIVTSAHIKKIDELAAMRGWSPESLQKFCRRVIKKDAPATAHEANKITEGLKAMNRRDGLLKFPRRNAQPPVRNAGSSGENEPSFRRVA